MDLSRDIPIQVEKPCLAYPISLIIDDGVPCLNPLYYFFKQVGHDRPEEHLPTIPLDLLEQFADVIQRHGMRGKFTVIPYPAGLGTIVDGWPGCDRRELGRWLEITRTTIAARFDITPEMLTHTLALDLITHQLIPQAEHIWMADRTQAELSVYMSTAVNLLRQAGFSPTGITQPCFFKGDRAAYDQAVLEAIRPADPDPAGTVTFYFIDFNFDEPVPPHPVVLLDRAKGEAVVSILCYADDFFWDSQYPEAGERTPSQQADDLITADGQGGRLVELIHAGAWTNFVTHWQSLYSNGRRQGIAGLDEVGARLSRTFGTRLLWMTNSQVARYRAAEEALKITPLGDNAFQLDSAFDCPDFTLTMSAPGLTSRPIFGVVITHSDGAEQPLARDPLRKDGLISSAAWRMTPAMKGQAGSMTVCFNLRRGVQILRLV